MLKLIKLIGKKFTLYLKSSFDKINLGFIIRIKKIVRNYIKMLKKNILYTINKSFFFVSEYLYMKYVVLLLIFLIALVETFF